MAPTSVVQEVESLRVQGRCGGWRL